MKTAQQIRERANFLRKMAIEAKNDPLSESYLQLAQDWERMAEKIDSAHANTVSEDNAAGS